MSRYLMLTLASALSLAGWTARPTPAAARVANHFSLVLEHSAQGWRARCDTGCRWAEVSFSCGGCEVRLTSLGMTAVSTPEEVPGTFAFTLTDSGSGWAAKSLRGAGWITLSYWCPQVACRARIDETGVLGLTPNRLPGAGVR